MVTKPLSVTDFLLRLAVCLTSSSSHAIMWRELLLDVFSPVLLNSCFSPLSHAPAAPQPEVAQKSISDFPFNSCKMVKVHSVLSEMGHFRRGLYGLGGGVGGFLKLSHTGHGVWGEVLTILIIWMYCIKIKNCRIFLCGFVFSYSSMWFNQPYLLTSTSI